MPKDAAIVGATVSTSKWPDRLEASLVFVVAVLVRAVYPDSCFFGVDQVGTLDNARAVLAGDLFVPGPGIGWSSLTLGPLYNQVAAIGLAARGSFGDVVVLVAMLHGLAILGYRALFARWVDPRLARCAAFVLALHPNSVAMGASPISSSLVLPTTLVFVWGCVRWSERRDPWGFALACLGASLMVQAHGTTVFLLPLFALGFHRRAPIGDVGLIGLLASALILSPSISDNLRSVLAQPEGLHHARGEGASYLVAAVRAAMLERRVAELGVAGTDGLGSVGVWAGTVLGLLALGGAARALARPPTAIARTLFVFCLVVPTACVVAIPRGSLYYYLESTLPFRSLAIAVVVVALLDFARQRSAVVRIASWAGVGVVGLASVLAATDVVSVRSQALAEGVLRVRLARVDLREPRANDAHVMAVPTLRAQQALGQTLGDLGFVASTFAESLHGPWHWMLAHSTSAFVGDRAARVPGALGSGRSTPRRALLVLHRRDSLPVPPGPVVESGAFRIHEFEDRIAPTEAPDDGFRYVLAPSDAPVVVHVVVPNGSRLAEARLDGAVVSLAATVTHAGFVVLTARVAGSAAPRMLALRAGAASAGDPLVQTAFDVYGFADAVP